MSFVNVGSSLKDADVTFEQRERDLKKQERLEEQQRRENAKSPFQRFAQQNADMLDVMMELADSPLAMKMYFLIVKKMNNKNALAASYQFFMDYFKVSKPSVCRAVKTLRDKNVLQVKRRNGMTIYLLNPEIVWKGRGNAVKYCEFEGTILITEGEWNEDDEE